MDRTIVVLVCLAATGSVIVGGVLYAFPSFVMRALARIAPEQGIAAMNSINVVDITPSFMIVFAGTSLLCLGLTAVSYFWWQQLSGKLILVAALLYVVASFGLTMMISQRINLKLAALPSAPALAYWQELRLAAC